MANPQQQEQQQRRRRRRHATYYQSYAERAERPNLTPLATYLLDLIHLKRTNLCVSADVTSSIELLRLAEDVGEHICVLKTHADIITDFTDRTMRGLIEVSRRKRFVVFEDRKFGDIGNTVQQQYTAGPLQIVRWASIVNAHLFPGPDIIPALAHAAQTAIASHNTSVQTSISASPAPSAVDSDEFESIQEGNGSLLPNGRSNKPLDSSDSDSDSDSTSPDAKTQRLTALHNCSGVSVSTTISTRSEAISPDPSIIPHSLSREASADNFHTAADKKDHDALLEKLGPPPFYRSLLLLAQMSSRDNFLDPPYTTACLHHARAHRDFVMGFVAQESLNTDPDDAFITMTPGVQLPPADGGSGGDALGQRYNTPRAAIHDAGSDIIIVGRGIYATADRKRAALEYRQQGWAAYCERVRPGPQQ